MITAIKVLGLGFALWFAANIALAELIARLEPADEDDDQWLADQPMCCDFHTWESELHR